MKLPFLLLFSFCHLWPWAGTSLTCSYAWACTILCPVFRKYHVVVSEGEGDLLIQVTESPSVGLSGWLAWATYFTPKTKDGGSFPTVHMEQEGSVDNTQHKPVSTYAPVLGLDFSCSPTGWTSQRRIWMNPPILLICPNFSPSICIQLIRWQVHGLGH